MRRFQSWLKQLILEWREQVENLELDYALPVKSSPYWFHSPCQVDIIHAAHPHHRFDYRLCIFSHFEDEPDLSIKMVGEFRPDLIPSALESYIKSPRWQRPLPKEEIQKGLWAHYKATTYADALSNAIVNAYSGVQTYLNNSMKSEGIHGQQMGMGALPGGCFFWGFGGPIEKTNPDLAKYVATLIAEQLRLYTSRTQPPVAEPTPRRRRGLGAFLLPPVWVGKAPRFTVRDYLEALRPEPIAHQNVVLKTLYKATDLTVTQSGCFVLATEDNNLAAQSLNELFSVALFAGIPALYVAPTDFVEVNDFDKPFTSYGYGDELSSEQRLRLEGARPRFSHIQPNAFIPVEAVQKVLQEAEVLTNNPNRALAMEFCLQAWAFLQRLEYRSAFLAAWTAIERNCYQLWSRNLEQGQLKSDQKKRLERWEVSRVIDTLRLNRLLNDEQLSELDKARSLRNSVMHEGKPVTKDQARDSIALALQFTAEVWELTLSRDTLKLLYWKASGI